MGWKLRSSLPVPCMRCRELHAQRVLVFGLCPRCRDTPSKRAKSQDWIRRDDCVQYMARGARSRIADAHRLLAYQDHFAVRREE